MLNYLGTAVYASTANKIYHLRIFHSNLSLCNSLVSTLTSFNEISTEISAMIVYHAENVVGGGDFLVLDPHLGSLVSKEESIYLPTKENSYS